MAFLNTPAQTTQIPNFNPQQLQVLQQLLQQGGQGLQNNTFAPYAQKARENFASQTVPLLAERFGAQGDERGSSALTHQLLNAGQNFESTLSQMGAQHDQQLYALMAQLGLTPQNENIYEPEKAGFAENAGSTFLSKILPALLKIGGGALGGFAAGGPVGAVGGAAAGIGNEVYNAYNAPSSGSSPMDQFKSAQQTRYGMAGAAPMQQQQTYNPGQYNPNVIGAHFSQLNKFNQNPIPRLA